MEQEHSLPPLSREQILDVLKRQLLEAVDGLTEERIATAKSFDDLGADSLAVVDVITGTTRELKIRVSRSDLAGVRDIEGLVTLFQQARPASSAPHDV